MKRCALFLAGWLIGAAGALCFGQAQKPLPEADSRLILKQMAVKLGENTSLRARFHQERRLALFDDALHARGVFFFRSPGRIRWEFVEPYASIILMHENGRVEKFDVVEGRARRVGTDGGQALAEVLNRISSWLDGDMERALQDFVFQMFPGGNYRLVLRPRSAALAAMLSRIEFEIDPGSFLVQAISLWENESGVTVIRFFDQSLNEPLADALFDLKKPQLLRPGESR